MSGPRISTLYRLCHHVGNTNPAAAGPLSQALASRAFNATGRFMFGSGLPESMLGRALSASASSTTIAVAPAVARAAGRRTRGGINGLLNDYKQLSKFKLSALVVATSAGGYIAGSGDAIDWAGLGWTAIGTFGAAACANTFNQLYEVANDARMSRTMNRPLPAGRVSRLHAAMFALTTGAVGLAVLHEKANPLTAGLGAANIALYAGVYTPLKQVSIANTWVGALVGAIPPLMGWAAASGTLEPGSAVLAGALFSWQMPHFLSLAWFCKEDYIRGGFQMLSRVDGTGLRTAAAALRHCAYLAPLGYLAVLVDVASWPFAFEAAAMSAGLGAYAAKFYAAPGQQAARKLFRVSLVYLPLLMVLMALHRTPNSHVSWAELQDKFEGSLSPSMLMAVRSLTAGVAATAEVVEESVASVASRLDSGIILAHVRCPSRVYAEEVMPLQKQSDMRTKS